MATGGAIAPVKGGGGGGRRAILWFSRGGLRGQSDTPGVLSGVRPPSRGCGSAAGDRGRGLGRVPLRPVAGGGHVAVGRVLCPAACPVQYVCLCTYVSAYVCACTGHVPMRIHCHLLVHNFFLHRAMRTRMRVHVLGVSPCGYTGMHMLAHTYQRYKNACTRRLYFDIARHA